MARREERCVNSDVKGKSRGDEDECFEALCEMATVGCCLIQGYSCAFHATRQQTPRIWPRAAFQAAFQAPFQAPFQPHSALRPLLVAQSLKKKDTKYYQCREISNAYASILNSELSKIMDPSQCRLGNSGCRTLLESSDLCNRKWWYLPTKTRMSDDF